MKKKTKKQVNLAKGGVIENWKNTSHNGALAMRGPMVFELHRMDVRDNLEANWDVLSIKDFNRLCKKIEAGFINVFIDIYQKALEEILSEESDEK